MVLALPRKKTANNLRFDQPWDLNEPIEALLLHFSVMAKPPFTLDQVIDKAIIEIQRTGLYETALFQWLFELQGFDDEAKFLRIAVMEDGSIQDWGSTAELLSPRNSTL